MTFGHLKLWSHSIIPWPHFLYKFNCESVCVLLFFCFVFLCVCVWLWLSFCLHWWIHCIAMNLSIATDDLVLILKNIYSMAIWQSSVRCNYTNICFLKNPAFKVLLVPHSDCHYGCVLGPAFLFTSFPRLKVTLSTKVSGMVLFPKNECFSVVFLWVFLTWTDVPNYGILCG